MNTEETIPVTMLSGTLGAGKTTILNHILDGDHGKEIAVLVNDVGEINVDAEIVETRTDNEEIVELSNGCICCGLQGQLERAVFDLAMECDFEHLLVEPSGISEPAPVAQQFTEGRQAGIYDLQSVTTVVNCRQFYDAFEQGQVQRHGQDRDGLRPLSDLIVEGVEFCDTLILNKTDLVSKEEIKVVRADIKTLQPDARVITTKFGQVDPASFLERSRFDRETVEDSARWRKTITEHDSRDKQPHVEHTDHESGQADDHDHIHPPEQYGIDSFVYHRPEPMHPERLADFLRKTPENLIRGKGWLHVADRPNFAMELSLAGQEAQVSVAGRWIVSLPEPQQKEYRERHDPNWTEEYGDRETKLVIIGRKMDTSQIKDRLDACLLDSETLNPDTENPFPKRQGVTLQLSTE